ncbi:hypothetical protein [Hominiventricola filiformis]|uniref:Uncharacterized protein n=1 Tax=Hominiventricola filiformis TaxID=2885352 RepID=A0AAE3DAM2_9FIRM|nr:hypothetical protein [Hominiventricola filiformis]MCC2125285.1 hypothetical protein [Hominiventricola filiformis]
MTIKEKIKTMLVNYTMKQFPEEFFKEPVIEYHDAIVKTFMVEQKVPLLGIPETDDFEDYMKKKLASMIAEGVMQYMEFYTHEETEDRFPCRIYKASLKVVTSEEVWRTCKMK